MYLKNIVLIVVLLCVKLSAADLLGGLEHHHHHDHEDHHHDEDHAHNHEDHHHDEDHAHDDHPHGDHAHEDHDHHHDDHTHEQHAHDDHHHHHEDHEVSIPDYEDLPNGIIQFLPNLVDPFASNPTVPKSDLAEALKTLSFNRPIHATQNLGSGEFDFGSGLVDNTVEEDPLSHLIPVVPAGQSESFESLFHIEDDVPEIVFETPVVAAPLVDPQSVVAVRPLDNASPVGVSLFDTPNESPDTSGTGRLDVPVSHDDVDYKDASQGSTFDDVSNFIGGQGRQLDQQTPVASGRQAPSDDYPTYDEVPSTSFRCADQQYGGYFADAEAGCQVFHICMQGHLMGSFLCPNQTLFNQELFVCDWWYNVDCVTSSQRFELNALIGVSETS